MWKIKFNQVQDLSDARFAASAMAEWIGFSIDGPHAVDAGLIQEIIGWCAGPKLILEVGDAPITKINSFIDVLPVDGIECAQDRIIELKSALPDITEWIVLGNQYPDCITHSTEWHQNQHIVLLEPNIQNAHNIIEKNPMGFSLNCQKEAEIGKKDLSHWHDFFEQLDLF